MPRHTTGTRLTGVVLAALCFIAAAWVFHAGPRQSGALFVAAETAASARR